MRVEVRLFRHVADALLEGGEVVVDAFAVVKDLPVGRLDQPGQHLDRGALAGAVRPQVAEDLSGPDGETHLAHGGRVVVVLRQRSSFEHRDSTHHRHRQIQIVSG